jgi:hypothetical protein
LVESWVRRHRRGIAAISALVVALGLYWFQPWKLFTDTTVNDALPVVATVAVTPDGFEPSAVSSSSPPPPGPPPSSPPPSSPPSTTLLARGSFISHEHSTSGTASIVQQPDGSRVLALANLRTSDGPDLRVWLADAPVKPDGWHTFDNNGYHHVSLGPLKGNRGNQTYTIPATADLARLTSVTIWCDRFNVSFGAVALKPT